MTAQVWCKLYRKYLSYLVLQDEDVVPDSEIETSINDMGLKTHTRRLESSLDVSFEVLPSFTEDDKFRRLVFDFS